MNKLKVSYQAFKITLDFFGGFLFVFFNPARCFIVRLTFSALVLCEGRDCSPLLQLI